MWRSPLPKGILGDPHLAHMITSNVPSSRDFPRSESVRPEKLNTRSAVPLISGIVRNWRVMTVMRGNELVRHPSTRTGRQHPGTYHVSWTCPLHHPGLFALSIVFPSSSLLPDCQAFRFLSSSTDRKFGLGPRVHPSARSDWWTRTHVGIVQWNWAGPTCCRTTWLF